MTQRFERQQQRPLPIIAEPEFTFDKPAGVTTVNGWLADPRRFLSQLYRPANITNPQQLSAKYSAAIAIAKHPAAPLELLRTLVQDFIPADVIPTEVQQKLKNNLTLMVVDSNKIGLNTPEALEARRWLITDVLQRPDLQALAEGGVDEGLLGLCIASTLLSDTTDSFKASERISWILHGLLRDFMGNLKGKITKSELPMFEIVNKTPDVLFENPETLQYNLIKNSYTRELMKKISLHGEAVGIAEAHAAIAQANSANKQAMMGEIAMYLEHIAAVKTPASLRSEITVKGWTKQFPSFEQKGFWYEFDAYQNKILAAETGLGKTMAAYFTTEKLFDRARRKSPFGVNRVLVVVPSKGRDVWESEAQIVFKKPENTVFTVKSFADLSEAAASACRYVVITEEMIARIENRENVTKFITDGNFDGAIFDEIDDLSNPDSHVAQHAYEITKLVQNNWHKRREETHPKLLVLYDDYVPIIGLTATLIKTKVSDLNVPMGLLYSEENKKGFVPFYEHGDDVWGRKTFSDRFLNRPDLAYMAMTGDHRIYRWESAEGVQKMEYNIEKVEISPFEEYFYTYLVQHAKTSSFHKIRLLGDALLNQYLAKASARNVLDTMPSFDPQQATDLLRRVTYEWVKKYDSLPLNEDRLVELGLGDLVVSCFLQDAYPQGISTFIQSIPETSSDPLLTILKKLWHPKKLTNKYDRLRTLIHETLSWQQHEDGSQTRRKVMLISPVRKENITSLVKQKMIKNGENGDDIAVYSEEELALINHNALIQLLPQFVKGYMDPEDILVIDGNVKSRKERKDIITRWVSDPDAALLLVTMKTVYQSIDLMIQEIADGRGGKIEGVRKIFLEPPWYWQQLKQMVGRSQRRGQIVPVENTLLVAKDLIDEGKERSVYVSGLLSKMMLSGMLHLTAEEAQLIDSLRTGPHVPYHNDLAVRNALVWMKNIGEDEIIKFYESTSADNPMRSTVNGIEFAQRFYDNGRDLISKPGHLAELISRYIKTHHLEKGNILSIGAGTLALSRRLKRPIHNVDLNGYMMEIGREEIKQFETLPHNSGYMGKYIIARASRLTEQDFPSQSYDFIDCSNALDFSSLRDSKGSSSPDDSERWRIIRQMHRLLKPGGKFALALPENSVDAMVFNTYIHVLETYGGFTIDKANSGKGFGIMTDTDLTKELGWVIFAQKTGPMQDSGLPVDMLALLTDSDEWTSNHARKRLKASVVERDYPISPLFGSYDEYRVIPPDVTRRRNQKHVIIGHSQNPHDFEYIEPVIEMDEEYQIYVSQLLQQGETEREFAEAFLIPLYKLTRWSLAESEIFIQTIMKQQEKLAMYPESPSQLYAYVLAQAEREIGLLNGGGDAYAS